MLEGKKVLCSAGVNFCMVYPNGDVYRCMRDYNTGRPPLFNIKNYNMDLRLHRSPFNCRHRICNTSCDSDWATKWLFAGGELYKKIPATEWDDVGRGRWASQELDDESLSEFLMMVWTPTLICNYSCKYCGCASGVNNIKESFNSSWPQLSDREWMRFFENILSKFEWGVIQTNGGEPLLSSSVVPVLSVVANSFAVNLVSNLSVNVTDLVRANISPYSHDSGAGLRVTASLHPSSKSFSWDQFLGKLLLLKDRGLLRGVNFVGWPEQLFLYEYYRDMLARYEIEIWLQPWVGPDNFGYSEYSAGEMEYLNRFASPSRKLSNQLDLSPFVDSPYFDYDIEVKSIDIDGYDVKLSLAVENNGIEPWCDGDDLIRVGARVCSRSGSRRVDREFRGVLGHGVSRQGRAHVDVCIDTRGLLAGDYVVVLDLVKEGCFWFEQHGCAPVSLALTVGESGVVSVMSDYE